MSSAKNTGTDGTSRKDRKTLYTKILDEHWVCNNCFTRRADPIRYRDHVNSELKYDATVEYAHAEGGVSQRRGTFCRCGCDGDDYRNWPDTLTPDQQIELFMNLAQTLDQQGYPVQKPVVFHHAVLYLNEEFQGEPRSEEEFDDWLHQRLPDITED